LFAFVITMLLGASLSFAQAGGGTTGGTTGTTTTDTGSTGKKGHKGGKKGHKGGKKGKKGSGGTTTPPPKKLSLSFSSRAAFPRPLFYPPTTRSRDGSNLLVFDLTHASPWPSLGSDPRHPAAGRSSYRGAARGAPGSSLSA